MANLSAFEELIRKTEVQLNPIAGENYGSHMERSLRGIGYALLAHAKAMEDIAKAIELHAKMQSRPSM